MEDQRQNDLRAQRRARCGHPIPRTRPRSCCTRPTTLATTHAFSQCQARIAVNSRGAVTVCYEAEGSRQLTVQGTRRGASEAREDASEAREEDASGAREDASGAKGGRAGTAFDLCGARRRPRRPPRRRPGSSDPQAAPHPAISSTCPTLATSSPTRARSISAACI